MLILVVDDNEAGQLLVSSVLTLKGFVVIRLDHLVTCTSA